MGRPATGTIIEREAKLGTTYAGRFRAYGEKHYVTLGDSWTGYNRAQAEQDLANLMADVRRGLWHPERKKRGALETFSEFSAEWMSRKRTELGERTAEDYEWAIGHLRPFFGKMLLADITARDVDRYKSEKAAIGKLGANAINKTLTRLSQILGDAVDYELIPSNPAAGRKRRLKSTRPARPYLEPEQLPTFLAATKDMYGGRGRALMTVLTGCGLRIEEALSLRRSHVNLASRTLTVVAAKTDAGVRVVDLTPAVHEELAVYLFDLPDDPEALVFGTKSGRKDTRQNVRQRLLLKAVEKANPKLTKLGIDPIGHLTNHGLRRTYASLRFACGDDPAYLANQIGHTDMRFTLSVYAHALKRRERLQGTIRQEFDKAVEWAQWTQTETLCPNPTETPANDVETEGASNGR